MKLMKDMNRDELIELVAAVSFRVLAFTYAFSAIESVVFMSLEHCIQLYTEQSSNSHYAANYNLQLLSVYGVWLLQFLCSIAIAVILFRGAVPLARLVCRGLSLALEPLPIN